MTIDHALFFTVNGPREGRESIGMEAHSAFQAFWSARKEAGDIADFTNVMLASTNNANTPAGFTLVTGERAKLHAIRWDSEEFLKLHSTLLTSFDGYACIDGYAGQGFDRHLDRLKKLMSER
jgi:hypothetical protein